jgi:hypothetical protein
VNRIIFPISFSVSSLLVYRKAIDFYVVFISLYVSKNVYDIEEFIAEIFWFFKYRITSPENKDNLTSFLPI